MRTFLCSAFPHFGATEMESGRYIHRPSSIALHFVVLCMWPICAMMVPLLVFTLRGVLTVVGALLVAEFIIPAGPEASWFRSLPLWAFLRKVYLGDSGVYLYGEGAHLFAPRAPEKAPPADTPIGTMACYHPHGVLALGLSFGLLGTGEGAARFKPATHPFIFSFPVLGRLARWLGAVSVDRSTLRQALLAGTSILICPDGLSDISCKDDEMVIRTGFLELARETGALIVPIWSKYERSYFSVWSPFQSYTKPFFGYPIPTFFWPPVPRRHGVHLVVGAPFDASKYHNVADARAAYYEELRVLAARPIGGASHVLDRRF